MINLIKVNILIRDIKIKASKQKFHLANFHANLKRFKQIYTDNYQI